MTQAFSANIAEFKSTNKNTGQGRSTLSTVRSEIAWVLAYCCLGGI